MTGRPVILLESHHRRVGEIGLEAQDVPDLGAPPAIDALIIIADAAEIAVPLRQEAQPEILGDIGVLVLVDQDVPEALVIGGEHLGSGGEQP